MLVYEILVCEFMSLCVDEDMGLWLYANVVLRVYEDVGLCRYVFVWLLVCLLARRHVNLQLAYCPPSFHKNTHPSLLVERGEGSVYLVRFVTILLECVRFYLATS